MRQGVAVESAPCRGGFAFSPPPFLGCPGTPSQVARAGGRAKAGAMLEYFVDGMQAGAARVRASFHKNFEHGGRYLISVWFGLEHGHKAGGALSGTMPQTWAVMDDFGALVCVEEFK